MATKATYTKPAVDAASTEVVYDGHEMLERPPMVRIMVSEDGTQRSFYYRDENAQSVIDTINKADLSQRNIGERLMDMLIEDGQIAIPEHEKATAVATVADAVAEVIP